MKQHIWRVSFVVACILLLSGCSGGTDLAKGGIGGTGFTAGPISAFGSIFVNGIRYDTSQAEVVINGATASADDLRLGMMVSISGTWDGAEGSAARIEFEEDLRGPVSSVNMSLGVVQVLGQSVSVDNLTVLDGVDSLAQIGSGDVVQVSGLNSDGKVYATRLLVLRGSDSQDSAIAPDDGDNALSPEINTMQQDVTLRGRITRLDSATHSFQLGNLRVDYSQTRQLPQVLNNGDEIAISGELSGELLQATQIRSLSMVAPNTVGASIKLTGLITRFASAMDFDINQIPAQVDNNTVFRFGSVADLRQGIVVIVSGQADTDGRLRLSQIELRQATEQRTAPGLVQITARVQRVTADTLQLAGIPVQMGRNVQFFDKRLSQTAFNLNSLNDMDTVTVFGFVDLPSKRVIAEKIQRETTDTAAAKIRLQAPLDSADATAGRLSMLGKNVEINGQTEFFDKTVPTVPPQSALETRQALPAASFFARAAPGRLVAVYGVVAGDLLVAQQVFLLE
jgi:hypothetical protein